MEARELMPDSLTTAAELARQQIQAAREYTLTLLEDVDDEFWTIQVPGYPSHIAWQVGHLAMAEYALTVLRIRGKEPEDQEVISNTFFKTFKKGSAPVASEVQQPDVAEIRRVFTNVHAMAMDAIPTYGEELLAESLPAPYMVHPNKLGSLLMCSAHEMLHAGQIGLLRRALGKAPIR
jgi:hypothetical protein